MFVAIAGVFGLAGMMLLLGYIYHEQHFWVDQVLSAGAVLVSMCAFGAVLLTGIIGNGDLLQRFTMAMLIAVAVLSWLPFLGIKFGRWVGRIVQGIREFGG